MSAVEHKASYEESFPKADRVYLSELLSNFTMICCVTSLGKSNISAFIPFAIFLRFPWLSMSGKA